MLVNKNFQFFPVQKVGQLRAVSGHIRLAFIRPKRYTDSRAIEKWGT